MTKERSVLLLSLCLLGAGCDPDGQPDELKPGESTDGERPRKETTTNTIGSSLTQSRDLNQPWIGTIPWTIDANHLPSCPDGYEFIKFDDEDHSNRNNLHVDGVDLSYRNSAVGGIQRVPSPRRPGGNTKLVYCKKVMHQLPALAYDYAVISAGNVCPSGSFRFARRWDNEDSSNHNTASSDIAPNSTGRGSNGWTWINFCFVPGQAGAPIFHDSFKEWLVWTKFDLKPYGGFNGRMYTDDEDDSNNNQYTIPPASQPFAARIQSIITAGKNTTMHFGGVAVERKDYGTGTSCESYSKVSNFFYGASVIVLEWTGDTDVGFTVGAALFGVGLFIDAYCWW